MLIVTGGIEEIIDTLKPKKQKEDYRKKRKQKMKPITEIKVGLDFGSGVQPVGQ